MARTKPASQLYAATFAKKICQLAKSEEQFLERKIDTELRKILIEMESYFYLELENEDMEQPAELDIKKVIENLHWIVDFADELYSRFGSVVSIFDIICTLLDVLNKWKDALFNALQVSNYTFYRTDIRLDSCDYNFKQMYKLNLLLISLLAIVINDPNRETTMQEFSQSKEYSEIATTAGNYQVKYYDKARQSHDTDPAKARLEFRCLYTNRIGGLPPHDVMYIWFKKLDKLPNLFSKLQEQCNKALHKAYMEHCKFCGKAGRKRDFLTEFLSVYSHTLTIFTRKQLREFLKMCGVGKNKVYDRTNHIIQKADIEFFDDMDLWNYIEKIKGAMLNFISY